MKSEIEVRIAPVSLPCGPRETMARLRGHAHHALLESALPMSGQATWSFIAGPARATLRADRTVTRLERAGMTEAHWDDPFDALRSVLPRLPVRVSCDHDVPDGLDFVGGWVGVLGYDTARHLYLLPECASNDSDLPEMWWMAVDQVLAFHHPTGQWWHCTSRGPGDTWPWTDTGREAAWSATLDRAGGPRLTRTAWHSGRLTQRTNRVDFEGGVRTIRDAIANGDMLQVNLTRREDASFDGDAWSLYEDLVAAHPAPFCAYLEAPGFAIASCSPERFLRLRGDAVQARPIKGTAARGRDADEDAANRAWLAASEKNRAENLMIVDLMRNDIGRVAQIGSVKVPHLFALEPYASVWQMVSTVEARLRRDCGPVDLLRACWPPGSMTGAPKLAAMQAIETLEPLRRGFYAGSIGFLDCRCHMDLSVVIRTAIVAGGRAMVQVGSGIVADSDPASEWDETVAKGAQLLQVLGRGSGSPRMARRVQRG